MPAERSHAALAGRPSGVSGNRSPIYAGSDLPRTECAGSGRMPDAPRTRSEPVVGA